MRVSIIIPFYNVEGYIARALLSALQQTYDNIEYVLIDDASTDSSHTIVNSIIEGSDRASDVKVVRHDVNLGVASARNTGIAHALGDYIYFLDSDDELPLHAIEKLVLEVGTDYPDIVVGEFDVIGGSRTDYVSMDRTESYIAGPDKVLNSFLSGKYYDGTCNKLVNRPFIEKNKLLFIEGIVHEDILWTFLLSLYANSLKYCFDITYFYHIRSNSITQSLSEKNFSSLLIILRIMTEICQEKYLLKTQPELLNYFANLRIYLFKGMVRIKKNRNYIIEIANEVNSIFSANCFKITSPGYSILSKIKILFYHLPIILSINLMKFILYCKK